MRPVRSPDQIKERVERTLAQAREELRGLTMIGLHGGGISQLVSAVEVAQDMARDLGVDDSDVRPITALIAVDVQTDFLPGGALGVEGGHEIIGPLVHAAKDADLVIASADKHPADHMSFEAQGGPWPEHCVIGTAGAQIHPTIDRTADFFVQKGYDALQEAYSAFDGFVEDESGTPMSNDLAAFLRENHVERVVVGGLALDYCVRATAIDAAKAGFDTIVQNNATRAVADDTGEQAVEDMREAGVHFAQPRPRPSKRKSEKLAERGWSG